jgi:hypothetical protein
MDYLQHDSRHCGERRKLIIFFAPGNASSFHDKFIRKLEFPCPLSRKAKALPCSSRPGRRKGLFPAAALGATVRLSTTRAAGLRQPCQRTRRHVPRHGTPGARSIIQSGGPAACSIHADASRGRLASTGPKEGESSRRPHKVVCLSAANFLHDQVADAAADPEDRDVSRTRW